VTLPELARQRWALNEPALLVNQRLNEVFRDLGLPPPRIAFESRSTALRLRTIASSRLIGFASAAAIRQVGRDAAVKVLPVPELSMRRPIGVIRRKEAYLSPIVQHMLDALRTLAAASLQCPHGTKRRPGLNSKT